MHLGVGWGPGDAGRGGRADTPQKVVWRSRIVPLLADRAGVMAIGPAVGRSKVTVSPWQERYLVQGIGVCDAMPHGPGISHR